MVRNEVASPMSHPLPRDPLRHHRLSLANIAGAADLIDPVFLNAPQYECEALGAEIGCHLTLKIETANPIRSFKGRGAEFLIASRLASGALQGRQIIAASAGNWGQALAYACRKRQLPLTLYASVNANPLQPRRSKARISMPPRGHHHLRRQSHGVSRSRHG